jgi:2-polyprenyl-3-methyl-5-hydroxy-6-metoxy-1,4-benzoquinol methylase
MSAAGTSLTPACPICAGAALPWHRLYDDRYGYPGHFELYRCRDCGHGALAGEFPPERLRELYTHYYPRAAMDLDQLQPLRKAGGLSGWLDGELSSAAFWVPTGVRVLDIGCGNGATLGYHQSRGCEAQGCEVDENILRIAAKFGYRVRVGPFEPEAYEPGYFDVATLNQVVEHATDPLAMLRGVATVLKPGGMAVLSTPNAAGWGARLFGPRWLHWHSPYHLQFFSRDSLRRAAAQAGLRVETLRTTSPSAWLHLQWLHLASRPPEGQASSFWAPDVRWAREHPRLRRAISLLRTLRIDHALTRAFDALGLGDNFVCVLRKP